jgi:hypothetical protein
MAHFTHIVANNITELASRKPQDLLRYLRFVNSEVVSPFERAIIKREVRRINKLKAKN